MKQLAKNLELSVRMELDALKLKARNQKELDRCVWAKLLDQCLAREDRRHPFMLSAYLNLAEDIRSCIREIPEEYQADIPRSRCPSHQTFLNSTTVEAYLRHLNDKRIEKAAKSLNRDEHAVINGLKENLKEMESTVQRLKLLIVRSDNEYEKLTRSILKEKDSLKHLDKINTLLFRNLSTMELIETEDGSFCTTDGEVIGTANQILQQIIQEEDQTNNEKHTES